MVPVVLCALKKLSGLRSVRNEDGESGDSRDDGADVELEGYTMALESEVRTDEPVDDAGEMLVMPDDVTLPHSELGVVSTTELSADSQSASSRREAAESALISRLWCGNCAADCIGRFAVAVWNGTGPPAAAKFGFNTGPGNQGSCAVERASMRAKWAWGSNIDAGCGVRR